MMKYKDSDDIHALSSQVLTIYFAIGCFFSLVACSYLDELIFFFVKNQDYHKGVYLIPLIMASILFFGVNNISNAGFLYKRKVTEISNICMVFALLSILASYLLIPRLGYLGAALSTFLIYASLSIALYIRSSKYFKINFESKKIIFFVFLNFGLIYFNYLLAIEFVWLRITIKTVFVLFSLFSSLFIFFGKNTLTYLKNPKRFLTFLTDKELQ
jgi:O-antigen/teichoic acid export membrane protein